MNAQQSVFLKLVVPPAQQAQKRWDVPASVTIAQAILESSNDQGWGRSQLAVKANNYFGIKATDLKNPEHYIELPTPEFIHGQKQTVEADFARYGNLSESFDAHGHLLSTAERYRPAMLVSDDPEMFCIRLQQCGYSTSPSYAITLQKLIKDYDLAQYDCRPDPASPAQEAA
jgi:flagellum-specific peptidoglycan hydrolase FlgJ